MNVYVTKVSQAGLEFSDGRQLYSEHQHDCCEAHELSFEHLTLADFTGLEFNLDNDNFFERVDGYGIRLLPINGHPIAIPGYGWNNGCYSHELILVISDGNNPNRHFDISECQVVEG